MPHNSTGSILTLLASSFVDKIPSTRLTWLLLENSVLQFDLDAQRLGHRAFDKSIINALQISLSGLVKAKKPFCLYIFLNQNKKEYRIKMSESYIEKRPSFDINEGLYGGISGDDGR